MKTPTHIRYFTKYLMDEETNKSFIKDLLITKGKKLVIAPTGAGKTCSIVKIMQEISKENSNKIFIIACPNRIQNLQNGRNYKITAIVGGEKVSEALTVASMVYDKANEIAENYFLTKNREIALIIDEAHQLIYSKGFRTDAINDLIKLEEKCSNIIHLTATPKALKLCYRYDEIAIFKPYKNTNNIKRFTILESKDKLSTLIQAINSILDKQGKVLLYLNNKNKANSVIKTLRKVYKDKNIDFINSDNKNDSETFDNIVTKEMIPEDLDILISTSIIECGTNIKNINYYPIMYIDNKSHFNVDSAVQFFARLRNEIELGLLIYQAKIERKKEEKYDDEDNQDYWENFWNQDVVLNQNNFYKEELKEAKAKVKHINNVIEKNSVLFKDRAEAEQLGKLIISSPKMNSTYGKGYIYIDDEDGMAKIDKEKFTKYCIEKCDTSLFADSNELIKALEEGIKSSNIVFCKAENDNKVSKEIKKIDKMTKKEIKEYREKLKTNFSKEILKKNNKELFIDYITSEYKDKEKTLQCMDNKFYNFVKVLEHDKQIINSIKTHINKYKVLQDINKPDKKDEKFTIEEILDMLLENNFDEYEIRKNIYLIFNNSHESIKELDIDYSIIRNVLDKKIQKFVNETMLLALYKTLNPRSKTKKLLPKQREKLLNEINLIYNTSFNTKGQLKINSFKKINK